MPVNMTLKEKIGQMIIAGFPGPDISGEYKKLVEEYRISNTILFSRNIENKKQLGDLCNQLQELIIAGTGYPAFIAVDQEGGMVTRLPGDATNIPGAMAIAATGDPENAYIAGNITGKELKALGINVNMAPDMDINSNKENPVIGVRSFGDTKELVTEYGIKMMKGLSAGQVLPIIKHFPGHGDTAVDSHIGLPSIDKSMEELMSNEIVPFYEAVNNGAEAVMTSHILFPKLEKRNVPATMSQGIITGLLRQKLGFKGLVFSDCLEMDAIKKYYGTARGAIEAIKAGVDIVCVSHTADLAEETARAIEAAALSGELSMEIIDRAVERILAYKEKYAGADTGSPDTSIVGCDSHMALSKRIRESGITLVRGNGEGSGLPAINSRTLFAGSYANRSTMASSSINKDFNFPEYMAGKFNGDYIIIPADPTGADIDKVLSGAGDYDSVVYGTYNGHMNPGQIELANRLCDANKNVIVVALRNPYDLGMVDKRACTVAAYEYSTLIFDVLADVFRGDVKPAGKLSVKV